MKLLTDRLPLFADAIAKLNKKAVKLGLPVISYVVGDAFLEEHRVYDDMLWCNETYSVSYNEVTITGDAPRLNGWNVTARVEPSGVEGQNFVFKTPLVADDADLDHLRTAPMHCEHCNIKRFKAKVYQITNEAGETKMVGSTCLKDFTRSTSVTQHLSFLDAVAKVFSDEENFGAGSANRLYSVRGLIKTAHYVIEGVGFVSKGQAADEGMLATADWFTGSNEMWKDFPHKNVSTTKEALDARAEEIINWIGTQSAKTDFMYNLQTAVKAEIVPSRMFGIIAAGVNSFLKDLARRVTLSTDEKSNQYFGTIGQRGELPELTIQFKQTIEGTYGYTYLLKFEDAAGNAFVWFSSKDIGNVGEKFKFKGTIKNHQDYQGRKQTIITRCTNIGE